MVWWGVFLLWCVVGPLHLFAVASPQQAHQEVQEAIEEEIPPTVVWQGPTAGFTSCDIQRLLKARLSIDWSQVSPYQALAYYHQYADEVLNLLVDSELIYQSARAHGFILSDDEVRQHASTHPIIDLAEGRESTPHLEQLKQEITVQTWLFWRVHQFVESLVTPGMVWQEYEKRRMQADGRDMWSYRSVTLKGALPWIEATARMLQEGVQTQGSTSIDELVTCLVDSSSKEEEGGTLRLSPPMSQEERQLDPKLVDVFKTLAVGELSPLQRYDKQVAVGVEGGKEVRKEPRGAEPTAHPTCVARLFLLTGYAPSSYPCFQESYGAIERELQGALAAQELHTYLQRLRGDFITTHGKTFTLPINATIERQLAQRHPQETR